MVAINVKVLQAFLSHAETNFDFLPALSSIRSFPESPWQSDFAGKQGDAMVRPCGGEIGAMTQSLMASAVGSMRGQTRRPSGKNDRSSGAVEGFGAHRRLTSGIALVGPCARRADD